MLYPRVSRRPSVRRRLTVFPVKFTIIIPAFNEAAYLGRDAGLDRGRRGAPARGLRRRDRRDRRGQQQHGRDRAHRPEQGGGGGPRAGAGHRAGPKHRGRHAEGDVLVFVDADVIAPPTLLDAIHAAMSDPACVGGGVDVDYRPQRLAVRPAPTRLAGLGPGHGMVQGATQFCRKSVFEQVGGLRRAGMDRRGRRLLWSLKRVSKRTGGAVTFIRNPRVRPSCRRFDTWPV